MANIPETFNPSIAYITELNGYIFQVLNESGDDWDEEATVRQIKEYHAST